MPPFFCHFLPPPADSFTSTDCVVVADILRATSVVTRALASGITEILPCLELDEAISLARATPGSLLCGERQGLKPDGFDLGNSPGDYTQALCQGRKIVMTTTNGTRALIASASAGQIYTFSFSNIWQTFNAISQWPGPVHLVGAGTDGQISWEDTLASGLLADWLAQSGRPAGNDAARIAMATAQSEIGWLQPDAAGPQPKLVEVLKKGRGGRRVCEIGLEKDIVEVARFNDFAILCQVLKNPLRIVRGQAAGQGPGQTSETP